MGGQLLHHAQKIGTHGVPTDSTPVVSGVGENPSVATFPETERYIQFLLEQLAGCNEHHVFEQIVFQIALRRLSSNIVPATGPVSAGGDTV